MLGEPSAERVYLACGSTDMRKSIDGLAAKSAFPAHVRFAETNGAVRSLLKHAGISMLHPRMSDRLVR